MRFFRSWQLEELTTGNQYQECNISFPLRKFSQHIFQLQNNGKLSQIAQARFWNQIKKADCRREIGPLNCHRASRQGPSQESQ